MKFSRQLGTSMVVHRHVNKLGTQHGCSGGGRGGGQGGCGCGGRDSRRSRPFRLRTDSNIITLMDGQRIEYHLSFKFLANIFAKMKQEDKDCLRHEHNAYKQ